MWLKLENSKFSPIPHYDITDFIEQTPLNQIISNKINFLIPKKNCFLSIIHFNIQIQSYLSQILKLTQTKIKEKPTMAIMNEENRNCHLTSFNLNVNCFFLLDKYH